MSSYLASFWSSPKKKKKGPGLSQTASQASLASAGSDIETDDLWLCQACKKSFSDEDALMLECERCSLHFCYKCVKMTKDDYKVLTKRTDIFWFCPPCVVKAKASLSQQVAIKECCDAMMSRVAEKLNDLAAKIETKLGQIKEDIHASVTTMMKSTYAEATAEGLIPGAQNDQAEQVSAVMEKTLEDQEIRTKQRESREGNIIIFRAEESSAEDAEIKKKRMTKYSLTACVQKL